MITEEIQVELWKIEDIPPVTMGCPSLMLS
jgi:hypothetical protein